ncbi:uncharacterized protein LOC131166332 [Malania oleifera]|uniref:uncharacterized protein LOC131166332 n=1 Tax=Malania oleifera TaxID=397392 RepID=UPI0025AE6A55|nr:uncharacterized protein LOC131166332 [Malania oleifera]
MKNMRMSLSSAAVLFPLIILFLGLISTTVEAGPPVARHRVRCKSKGFPWCYGVWYSCPLHCPTSCLIDCISCKPLCSCDFPGAVCQDPRFVGGDGIAFYFHGRRDQDFCLVSDTNLHINAHFIGKRNLDMKRDFTWVQSIGIIFGTHKLLVAAKTTSKWDDSVDHLALSFDNTSVSLPTKSSSMWQPPTMPLLSITRTDDTNRVVVEMVGSFRVSVEVVPILADESRVHGYNITNENCFAHLELGFKFYKLTEMVDGVLGQTYRKNYVSKAKMGVSMSVLGGADKFFSSNIMAKDCHASRFGKEGGY